MSGGIIVGGGIVGCACAHYLAQQGIRSTIIEPGPIGGGATAAGMGHIVLMDDSETQFGFTKYSQDLWDALVPALPKECEFRKTGTLWVAADQEEWDHVSIKQGYYGSHGVNTEKLDAKQLKEAEPQLCENLTGALLVPSDSVIYPMVAARWMADQANSTLVHARVHSLSENEVQLENGDRLPADFVINAAGGHAPQLTPGLPIQPRKGHLIITDRYPGFVNRQIIELGYIKSAHGNSTESVAFNVQPRATGQLLIGSSRQFVGWDPAIDRTLLAKMVDRALQYMPGLGSLSTIRTWVGFRAATDSKLPIIMRWRDGTYVAAGHEGLGITTCMATGKLIADMVTGAESAIDRAPFNITEDAIAGS